jgi:2-succinyl-6-hydroxy-2,4-cyclohexadiene-1-carboxylate synthase
MAARTACQLSFELHGDEGNPVLLLLHGFMGSGKDWAGIVKRLVDRYYCLTPDLPGHGNSTGFPDSSDYTLKAASRLISELLEELTIDTCSLLGYSMGGRIALDLCLNNSHTCNKLIIESASPGLRTDREREDRYKLDLERARDIESRNFRTFLTDWYAQPLFRSLKKHPDFPKLIERRLHNDTAELARSLRGSSVGAQPSLWEKLKDTTIPLLVLAGEKDDKYVAIAREMEEINEHIHAQTVKNSGHCIHVESEENFVNEIRRFLIDSEEEVHEFN